MRRNLFLLGVAPGITSLKVHDVDGKLLEAYTVQVDAQPEYARTVVDKVVGGAGDVAVDAVGGALFVSGTVKSRLGRPGGRRARPRHPGTGQPGGADFRSVAQRHQRAGHRLVAGHEPVPDPAADLGDGRRHPPRHGCAATCQHLRPGGLVGGSGDGRDGNSASRCRTRGTRRAGSSCRIPRSSTVARTASPPSSRRWPRTASAWFTRDRR